MPFFSDLFKKNIISRNQFVFDLGQKGENFFPFAALIIGLSVKGDCVNLE